ncbi:MAG TPA: zinc ABC transporter substrate-binding protein [Ignavibacteria bacterium]|nr:manganese transporter [Bacteroidota bacterium]HRI86264.1 zinc ABC transporter substrate-binding protein [Ignavibacteria bacterium]HRJ98384.1 zinc ABC transporter substrate-binding protein [Ignavibacteria bacterium]
MNLKILAAAVLLIISGCKTENTDEASGKKITAVSSINIISDIVKNIGGDKVESFSICGVGVDPHTYHAKPSDPRLISKSNIVFINGFNLEHWIEEMISSAGSEVKKVTVSEGITPITDEKGFGDPDPHAWFDVKYAKIYAENIAKGLSEADPKNADYYNENLKKYLTELDNLDNWIKDEIQKIPEEQRILITSHDAFRYFGKAYGMEVKGLQGISTEAKVRTEDFKNIIDLIKSKKIKSVFVETSVNPKLLEQISQETGVVVGGTLFSDSIGNEGTPEGSYTGAVKFNVNTIVNSLK